MKTPTRIKPLQGAVEGRVLPDQGARSSSSRFSRSISSSFTSASAVEPRIRGRLHGCWRAQLLRELPAQDCRPGSLQARSTQRLLPLPAFSSCTPPPFATITLIAAAGKNPPRRTGAGLIARLRLPAGLLGPVRCGCRAWCDGGKLGRLGLRRASVGLLGSVIL
jgi:hypothetical protein